MTSTPQQVLPSRRHVPSRKTGLLMAAEATTFVLASAIHFATGFTDAAIPELVIAAVLGAGSSAVLARGAGAWGIAVGTTAFATFGTVVGLTIIAAGRQDVPDLAYHASILVALAVTLIRLMRERRTGQPA
jgi:hypothetical protein